MITRPYIQYVVNYVCQRMHLPTVLDFGLLKCILRYLKGTLEMGLHLSKDDCLTLSA